MNANRCYRYTFCLAKWKEKWAQKMQNHSLTEISSKISSQLGISFQRSIQYLPLLCLEELSLDPNREKKQYIELREHFFCFFFCFFRCTIPSHPLYMSFLNLTNDTGILGRTEATLWPRRLFCCLVNNNKNRSLDTCQVYQ